MGLFLMIDLYVIERQVFENERFSDFRGCSLFLSYIWTGSKANPKLILF